LADTDVTKLGEVLRGALINHAVVVGEVGDEGAEFAPSLTSVIDGEEVQISD
jgi:hypothetical protein